MSSVSSVPAGILAKSYTATISASTLRAIRTSRLHQEKSQNHPPFVRLFEIINNGSFIVKRIRQISWLFNPQGSFAGLRARGDYTVNAAWNNGALTETHIFAGPNATGKLRLSYEGKSKDIAVNPGESIKVHY